MHGAPCHAFPCYSPSKYPQFFFQVKYLSKHGSMSRHSNTCRLATTRCTGTISLLYTYRNCELHEPRTYYVEKRDDPTRTTGRTDETVAPYCMRPNQAICPSSAPRINQCKAVNSANLQQDFHVTTPDGSSLNDSPRGFPQTLQKRTTLTRGVELVACAKNTKALCEIVDCPFFTNALYRNSTPDNDSTLIIVDYLYKKTLVIQMYLQIMQREPLVALPIHTKNAGFSSGPRR